MIERKQNSSNFRARRAATTVEVAVIAPLTFLILFGLVIGGMGIFRFFEVADLAREGARWASVHGADYASDTGNAAATAQDVYNNVIKAKAVGLDLNKLTYSVTWNTDNRPYHTTIVGGQLTPVTNTVRVRLTYRWVPEFYFRAVNLTSMSECAMTH